MTNCANEPGGLGSILSEARFVFFFLILFFFFFFFWVVFLRFLFFIFYFFFFFFFFFASFFSGIFYSLLASFPFWPLAPAT